MVQRNQIACPRWQMAQLRSRPWRPGSGGLACIHLAILSHGILQAEAEVSRDNIKQGGCFRDPCWVDTLNHILLSRELLETSAHDLPLPSEPWRKDKGHRVMHHLCVQGYLVGPHERRISCLPHTQLLSWFIFNTEADSLVQKDE